MKYELLEDRNCDPPTDTVCDLYDGGSSEWFSYPCKYIHYNCLNYQKKS